MIQVFGWDVGLYVPERWYHWFGVGFVYEPWGFRLLLLRWQLNAYRPGLRAGIMQSVARALPHNED